jgi:hypothetical protein
MSLRACKDCGGQVSTDAATCPACGKPQKRTPIGCGGGLVLMVLVAWLASAIVRSVGDQPEPTPQKASVNQKADQVEQAPAKRPDAEQKKLDEFVRSSIKAGAFSKVECRSLGGTVGVTPTFMASAFEMKEKLLTAVWAKCFPPAQLAVLRLVDSRTNREVGTFVPGRLDLD